MRWLKFVARIAIAIVAVWAVALVGFFFYGARSMCGNEILAEYPSPDGALKAVVFERDCGTTTDFSTQVSVMKREAALENSKGNVFIVDSDRGRAPSGSGGGPEAKLLWTGNRSIQIDHHVNARVSVARGWSSSDILFLSATGGLTVRAIAGRVFGEPRRGWMIWINCLRFASPHSRVAKP